MYLTANDQFDPEGVPVRLSASPRGGVSRLRTAIFPASRPALGLFAVSLAAILVLAGLRVADQTGLAVGLVQVVFLAATIALAVVDLRLAVGLAILELVCGGASGQWTQFPGGASGRIVLDTIVTIAAGGRIADSWRRTGRLDLGRYGPHALGLAVVMAGAWMALGLLNHNNPRDVFADGNGQLFLAFVLPLGVLSRDGHGAWLRRWLLVACAANALLTGFFILISVTNIVPAWPTLNDILLNHLAYGGNVGYIPNVAYVLALGSGLYLQVGLALVTWELRVAPRRAWPWALAALLAVDVIASYSRGFWVGSVTAIAIVVVLGAPSLARMGVVVGGLCGMLLAGTLVLGVIGYSLPAYVLHRVESILVAGPPPPPSLAPASVPPASASSAPVPARPAVTEGPTVNESAGAISNAIRAVQAQVLIGHFRQQPIIGHGWGTIAPDYPYGSIFSYELAYLDLLYKTGLIGAAIFLSFPLRLLVDAGRGRFGRRRLPGDLGPRETAVPIAILVAVLVTGATDPYVLSSLGLFAILACIAWLDPGRVAAPAGVGGDDGPAGAGVTRGRVPPSS